MTYGNRSPWKKIMSSSITLVVLAVAFLFLMHSTWKVYSSSHASAARLAQAEGALDDLKTYEDTMSAKVSYLSTDTGVASEIRSKFRAAAPGESVAVIIDRSPASSTSGTATSSPTSWWGRVLRVIGL